ncbi:MAG: FeoB small GTPase domain-containing protein [Candidatus Bipolaricaulota bacterium]
MKRILLIGNPNVGKSVVFSRLTGANVVASNYPGTTVDYTKGILSSEDQRYEVVDVPGVYSLESTSSAEKVATEMLETADIVVSVVDSTNLERNLFLTFELLERNVPIIVALNLCDEARLQGIDIDTGQLERSLGVPVVETVALSGEGIKELVDLLPRARTSDHGWPFLTHQEKWNEIGKITEEVQTLHRKEVTLKERLSEATIKPVTGIPIALMVIFLTFQLIRFVGEGLVKYVTEPFFHNWYAPLILRLNQLLGSGLWHRVLIGDLIEGEIEFMESMGVLTTGLFVPFAAVLPYIIALYFGLSLLEDSGYLWPPGPWRPRGSGLYLLHCCQLPFPVWLNQLWCWGFSVPMG